MSGPGHPMTPGPGPALSTPPPAGHRPPPQAPSPWQHPGAGPAGPAPSGATAIITLVLASLGVLASLMKLIDSVVELGVRSTFWASDGGTADYAPKDADAYATLLTVTSIVSVGIAAPLLVGSILFGMRRPAGRVLIVVGAFASFFTVLVATVYEYTLDLGEAWAGQFFRGGGLTVMMDVATLVFPIVTVVLACVPSTTRWLAAGPRP